jgi:UPF0271 protein
MSGFDDVTAVEARAIDLNADLGEGFPNDEALLEIVSSASVCCGAHAGSREVIRATLLAARGRSVDVGAHPGYADREHFGRRERLVTWAQVRALLLEQVEQLDQLGRDIGVPIRFVKPHGALYNQAQQNDEIARGVIAATLELGLPLVGQPNTLLAELAQQKGIRYVAEGFPERRYRADGSLVTRNEPDAILSDPLEIETQASRLIASGRFATLCIHGDDLHAVSKARVVRNVIERTGMTLRSFLDSRCR